MKFLLIFFFLCFSHFKSFQAPLRSESNNHKTSPNTPEKSPKFLEYKPEPLSFSSGFSVQGSSNPYIISSVPKLLPQNRANIASSLEYHHSEPPNFYSIPIQAELAMLTGKVAIGGHQAKKALERLNSIANHVNMDKYLKSFLPLAVACKALLIRQSEEWDTRQLCQSLYVRITNIPVTLQYANEKNGVDYGQESSIVVPRPSRIYRPDREIAKLRAGADLQHILDDKPLEY